MQTTPYPFGRHLIVASAIGVLAPFTSLAWLFAIATGIVIGTAEIAKTLGLTASPFLRVIRLVAVTGGVLAMLITGAIAGGIVAFLVAALAVLSERIAADASSTDRNLARILLLVGGALGWMVLGATLGFRLEVSLTNWNPYFGS